MSASRAAHRALVLRASARRRPCTLYRVRAALARRGAARQELDSGWERRAGVLARRIAAAREEMVQVAKVAAGPA